MKFGLVTELGHRRSCGRVGAEAVGGRVGRKVVHGRSSRIMTLMLV